MYDSADPENDPPDLVKYEDEHETLEHVSTQADFSQCSLTSGHMHTVKQLTQLNKLWSNSDIDNKKSRKPENQVL